MVLKFVDLELKFIDLALKFVDLVLKFVGLALRFVDLALQFVDLAVKFCFSVSGGPDFRIWIDISISSIRISRVGSKLGFRGFGSQELKRNSSFKGVGLRKMTRKHEKRVDRGF